MKASQAQKTAMNETRQLEKSRERSADKKTNHAELEKKVMEMRLKNQNLKT